MGQSSQGMLNARVRSAASFSLVVRERRRPFLLRKQSEGRRRALPGQSLEPNHSNEEGINYFERLPGQGKHMMSEDIYLLLRKSS